MGFKILQPQPQPLPGDVDAILDAWSIENVEIRKLCLAIARKPGALRLVDKTLKLAFMLAAGAGKSLGVDHVRQAWSNRSGEEAR